MAVAVTNLTSTAIATDATEYALPAVNIDKDSLILYTLINTKGTSPDAAVITGLTGATWEAVETVTWTVPVVTRHAVWRTMVGTSQNTVTLTASFGGATQTGFVGILDMVTGCATSGSNGAGAVVQSTWKYFPTALTYTSTLPSTPTGAVYGCFSKHLNTAMGAISSFTETADLGQGTPARRGMASYSLVATDTWTTTQPATAIGASISMEFLVQSSAISALIYGTRRLLAGVGV